MGVDFYICRKDTGTVFALGRWMPVVEAVRSHVMAYDDEILRAALRDKISAAIAAGDSLGPDPIEYADEVTRRIRAFAGNHFVEVVADHQLTDDFGDAFRDEHDRLRIADSVFTSDWEKHADAQ